MGLLKKITDSFFEQRAYKRIAKDPILTAATLRSISAFQEAKLDQHISERIKEELSKSLLDRILTITASPDPIAQCREVLADCVLSFSSNQVLVLDKNREIDHTGLIGTQGITGELKLHLAELAQKNDALKKELYGISENPSPTQDEVWDFVLMKYWRDWWFLETINAARIALKDCNPIEDKDWLKPFVHASCVFYEDQYRGELGLPSAIPESGIGMIPLMYSTFFDTVMSGEKYPDLAWREHYADAIQEGRLKPPFPVLDKAN